VASYYYLVASLPMLRFEQDPPMSMEKFLSVCREFASSRDYMLIESVIGQAEEPKSSSYTKKWEEFNDLFRSSLSKQRLIQLKRGQYETDSFRATRDDVDGTVKEAMQAANPLDAEILLMKKTWEEASSLSQGKVFEVEVLLTYAIQLQILLRKALFSQSEGNAEFRRLFSNLQSINQSM
jgi:hypothetical protein